VVLEVALSGAIGGAIVHSVLEQQRAIQRARLLGNANATSNNINNNDNDNSMSQHQDTDDPAVTFMMRSMTETAATSRLSSRQMTPAMGVDGNGSNSMLSYEHFLTSSGGNDRSEAIENTRAAVEQDIFSLPSVQVLPDMDLNKLPEDCRRCAICLDDFLPGSFRKTLPCWHGFHTQCVDKWLRNVGACPICKHCIDG
jgi:hypothetical protein